MMNRVIRMLDAIEQHAAPFVGPIEVTLDPGDFDIMGMGTDIPEDLIKSGCVAFRVGGGCRWLQVRRRDGDL